MVLNKILPKAMDRVHDKENSELEISLLGTIKYLDHLKALDGREYFGRSGLQIKKRPQVMDSSNVIAAFQNPINLNWSQDSPVRLTSVVDELFKRYQSGDPDQVIPRDVPEAVAEAVGRAEDHQEIFPRLVIDAAGAIVDLHDTYLDIKENMDYEVYQRFLKELAENNLLDFSNTQVDAHQVLTNLRSLYNTAKRYAKLERQTEKSKGVTFRDARALEKDLKKVMKQTRWLRLKDRLTFLKLGSLEFDPLKTNKRKVEYSLLNVIPLYDLGRAYLV